MERDNPLEKLYWLKGKWEGVGKKDELEYVSEIVFNLFTDEILDYSIMNKIDEAIVQEEKGFFFRDNLDNSVKHILASSEGYIYTGKIEIAKRSKNLIIQSTFDHGYNLPPNILIIHEIKREKTAGSFTLEVKMGKTYSTYSHVVYKRKT